MIFLDNINSLIKRTKWDKTEHPPAVKWDMSQRHPRGGVGLSQTHVRQGYLKKGMVGA